MTYGTVFRFALAVLLLSSSSAFAADASSAALEMVKKLRLGDNLGTMGSQVATNTQTYRNMVQMVGADRAQALIRDELSKTRPKYQDQWDRNLAAAYAESFTSNELESIAEKQKASPYANKFLAKQSDVGRSMQSKSTGLLQQYVAEALNSAFSKAMPKK